MVIIFEGLIWFNFITYLYLIIWLCRMYHTFKAQEEEWNRMLAEHEEKWALLRARPATAADIVDDPTCCICMEEIEVWAKPIVELQCSSKHIFHSDCAFHWLKTNNTCPLCGEEVKK